mgnify:CR=1 FL=1
MSFNDKLDELLDELIETDLWTLVFLRRFASTVILLGVVFYSLLGGSPYAVYLVGGVVMIVLVGAGQVRRVVRKHENAPPRLRIKQGFEPLALFFLTGQTRVDDHAVYNNEQAVLVFEGMIMGLKMMFILGDQVVVDG